MVRTELYINGVNGVNGFLSFPFGVNIPVSINFNLADVRNPEQRKASFSKTINLLGTNEVNKLFENLFEVNVVTQYFNKNLKTPVKYLVDGLENFAGDLQLIKVNINPDNSIVYECSIIGAGGSLFVDIGEKYITGNTNSLDDLDFSAYDHDYTRDNQIASRTNVGTGEGYVYPFIDRGTNGGSDTVWNVKDFLPSFSIYEYVKKIIEGTGRTFTSTFFESDFFKHLYCYSNITKVDLTETQLDNQQFYVGKNSLSGAYLYTPTTLNTLNKFIFDLDDTTNAPFFDLGSQYTNPIITINYNGFYNINAVHSFWFEWSHTNPQAVEARSANLAIKSSIEYSLDNGVTWNNLVIVSNKWNNSTVNVHGYGSNWIQSLSSGNVYITAGTLIRHSAQRYLLPSGNVFGSPTLPLTIAYYNSTGGLITSGTGTWGIVYENSTFPFSAGTTLYGLVSNKVVDEGEPLSANSSLPTKIKQKEFLTSILRAFNLFVDVNPNNPNDLLIEPFDEFYNTTDIVDYENRTDLGKEQTINPNLLEGKRYIYTYKEDKDYYNDLYLKTHNEVFGTEQIDVENDFIKSDKKTELIFSGTPLAANYGLGIAMPKIYTLDGTTKKTIAANIRLLYCDVKTSPNAYTYKQQGQTDLVTNEYLHAGMEDDALNPTVSLMFGPAKEFYYTYVNAYFTNNTLYNKYHKQYLVNLIDKDAKFVTKYLWLTPKDINEFSFRNRLFIDGSYYIVNKIENYTPLEQTSTKVELIKLLDTEVFMPASFLISDTTVNAGNEVYTSRLNSSLNVGTNIQNRGTNCLAIGENIVIPESCSNLIVFGSNITADENSTGLLLNYKSYVALITQSGTAAPTITILENTLGDIVWTRFTAGGYYGTLTGAFLASKTFVIGGSADITGGGGDFATLDIKRLDDDKIYLYTYDNFTVSDNLLNNTSIEIRVYN